MNKSPSKPGTDRVANALLHCPIRGGLNASALAADGLTTTEEARRIDCLNFLLDRDYPEQNIAIESIVVKKLGESGRGVLRADIVVYSAPVRKLRKLPIEERLQNAILVAEIKRESAKKTAAVSYQLEPALRILPGMHVMGVYWDDVNQLLFVKQIIKKNGDQHVAVFQDVLANLPRWGLVYKCKPLKFNDLAKSTNLVGMLFDIANVMRSHGINDEHVRYKETVKLILARYCDEREAEGDSERPLSLQVYSGADPTFMERAEECYKTASKRYGKAKTLFNGKTVTELSERTLRHIVKVIQGTNFRSASNETMQQVFMSFVPAVFKKSLDQYFTPIGLVEAMVKMARIGPNDNIADPAMGTADFLTAASEYRAKLGDSDILQRIHGMDSDPKAFDLAVVNMILNKDGQSNLKLEDSIARHELFDSEMHVALCNPPFGERSVETRESVLMNYDLGHKWEFDSDLQRWNKTEATLPSQQLGILFIERCFKMLDDKGRVAIILPEGYLCTPSYGYVRQWIIENLRILSLTELPRRVFVKSNADLRSNILLARKEEKSQLRRLTAADYPIHTDMVRRVGFKMGKGYSALYVRDPSTGLEIRDEKNQKIVDTDFTRVCDGFEKYTAISRWDTTGIEKHGAWDGARINDILKHPNFDLKPRRLMPKALHNIKSIKKQPHFSLAEIADVVSDTIDIITNNGASKRWRLVEGLDIGAVDGTVIPQRASRAWQIAERKSQTVYHLRDGDIVIGLVRPERRNIGLLHDSEGDVVGSTDGTAIVRIKPEYANEYPQEWLFATLRSEASRLQFWTESGGTSYGKLLRSHIENLLIPTPSEPEIQDTAKNVRAWAMSVRVAADAREGIGAHSDRMPIINSSGFGLIDVGDSEDEDGIDD